jgi:hypothetical protein
VGLRDVMNTSEDFCMIIREYCIEYLCMAEIKQNNGPYAKNVSTSKITRSI